MKKFSIVLIVSILVFSLASCVSNFDSVEIKITTSSWYANNIDCFGVSEQSEKTYSVSVGDTIDLGGCCNLTIEITSITDKGIAITTNTPMSVESKDGTINLLTDEIKFFIDKDEQLKLVTPTMDGGDVYRFDYVLSAK